MRFVCVHAGAEVIPVEAFRDLEGLRRVVFQGASLRALGASAFRGTALEEFVAPVSLRKIGDGAFADCRNLRRAVLNEGLERIGTQDTEMGIFQDSGLQEVVLPSTLRALGTRSFAGCIELRRVSLPEGLREIGAGCFQGAGIEEIMISTCVNAIRERTFAQCLNLVRVNFALGSTLEEIGA